jgi:hypothetical protein
MQRRAPEQCLHNMADGWLASMQILFGSVHLDTTRAAKIGLKNTLDEISDSENALNLETQDIVRRIKMIQSTGKNNAERVKPLLMQSRRIRGRLAVLAKKKNALETHMETLINSELNQHVLASMQKTSHALKGMGLDKSLESVDRVMLDLEENHNDIRDIQHTLGTSFEHADDVDFDLELCLLLDLPAPDRAPAAVLLRPPVSVNNIDDPTAPPALAESAAESAAEGAAESAADANALEPADANAPAAENVQHAQSSS